MALNVTSKLNASFKKLTGKAHTDNSKQNYNEAKFSSVTIAGETVFGELVPGVPSVAAPYDITDGVVEFVRLEVIPDPTSNGHAFLIQLPTDYQANSTNPNAGTGVFVDGQILADTRGQLQLVPPLFGLNYEAKPYIGGTNALGSGTLVPPGDARDWVLDYFNGVLFQEDDPAALPPNINYIECLIWVGSMVSDVVGGQGTADTIISKTSNPNVVGAEIVDSIDTTTHSVAKWFVKATKDLDCIFMEIVAVHFNGSIKYSFAHMKRFGSPPENFCAFTVDINGTDMRLIATTGVNNIIVEVVRIQVV